MEFQVKNVQFRLEYIHAERIPSPQHQPLVNVVLNVNVSGNAIARGEFLEIPFTINISSTPPIISISLRGFLVIQLSEGEVSRLIKLINEGKVPPTLQTIIAQYAFLETSLLARELGLPPIIPLQLQREERRSDIRYA